MNFPDEEILLSLEVLNSQPDKPFTAAEIYEKIKLKTTYREIDLTREYVNSMSKWVHFEQTNPHAFTITKAGINKLSQLKSDKVIKEQEERLLALKIDLSQSSLNTNDSIIEVNKSVKITNDSVRGMNRINKIDLKGQKSIITITLVIAGLGLVVQATTLFKESLSPDISKQLKNIDSTLQQIQISINPTKKMTDSSSMSGLPYPTNSDSVSPNPLDTTNN